jgi:two-component system CheB/CheR fusion protein
MDLTTCRNMLIYLQAEPQERVLGLLNFSLKPNGFLFLGSSESPSCLGPQLQPVNGRWRIYQATGARRQPVGLAPVRAEATSRWRETPARARASAADQLLERVHQELVKDLDVRCLVVDIDGHLAHSFGEVGRYLRMSSGPVDTRISSLLTPGLAEAVSGALRVAQREGKDVTIERVLTADQQVDVRIKPVRLAKPEGHYFFVYLLGGTKVAPSSSATSMDQGEISQLRVEHLEEKLHQTQASLQSTIEELETSNEELQATNEELVSANEELQSTNEELQSLNEELYTVNSELQVKIAEVSRANSDMNNLLAGANVATLFLEQSLNIRRFTPAAGQLLNLLDRDLGRPFVHIATTLRGGDLVDMAAKTAMHAAQHRTELRHDDGRHFLVTVMPYRTARGDDDGVVLTFVDISDLKRSAGRAEEAETRYGALTEHLPNGITVVYDRDLAVIDASGPGLRLLGGGAASLVGQPVEAIFSAEGDLLRAGLTGVFAGRTEQAVCRIGGRDLLVTLLPVGDGAAAHGMAVAQDITSLRSSLARLAHG